MKHAARRTRRRFPVFATIMALFVLGAGVSMYTFRHEINNFNITIEKHWSTAPPCSDHPEAGVPCTPQKTSH